jgi:F420-0:gamma-glutamyl ligase
MDITAFKTGLLTPPKDDLLSKIKASELLLQEGDCIAIASKVVAIHQGRCVARNRAAKVELVKQEADFYLDEPENAGVIHTIKNGTLIGNAGIDPLGDFYILWPEKPKETAEGLLSWFKKEYGIQNLALVIVDSRSVLMRQGAVGIALAWTGFNPLYDNRNRIDLLGTKTGGTQTNLPDSLAAAAALAMGEANEQTPLAVIRGVEYLAHPKPSPDAFEVPLEQDLYAPFLRNKNWRKGGGGLAL